nr:leucine-rich repeat protein [Tanacetum cinerariifolium]
HERLALLKFKHSVYNATDMLSSWVGNDCCKWERVHCDKVTGKVDSLHLRGRTVDSLHLRGRDEYLIGKESDDMSWISGLSSLKSLDLSYVNLSKAQNRDMVFYMMPSLVKLSLSECGLTNADLEHGIPGIPGPFILQFPAFFAKHDWFFSKAEFVKL